MGSLMSLMDHSLWSFSSLPQPLIFSSHDDVGFGLTRDGEQRCQDLVARSLIRAPLYHVKRIHFSEYNLNTKFVKRNETPLRKI